MLKSLLRVRNNIGGLKCNVRNVSTVESKDWSESERMKSWQVHSYGENLQSIHVRIPIIQKPNDILVKVEGSSVNPIDVAMKDGYGRTVLQLFKCQSEILPMTLGRDFSGMIVDKGHGIDKKYKCGDKVYGVIPFHKDGAHAEYAVVNESHICHRPEETVNHIEAASLPYAALTAWSALWLTGGFCLNSPKGKRVLILGASGGVGTCAVQILKAHDVCVFATCSIDAIPLVERLRADCIFDYNDKNFIKNVTNEGKYDIILDCAQFGLENIPKSWQYTSYITLNSPLLHHTDRYGLLGGLAYSVANIIPANLTSIPNGKLVKWAYVIPCKDGINFVHNLVKTCKLLPVIDSVFPFDQTTEAYKKTKGGHLRGKVVIDMGAS